MKENTQPENYRDVLFYDGGADKGWVIPSCAPTNKTMKWQGKEYPVFMLDTSAASHPAYTGKQRDYSNAGRASKFNQRYKSAMDALRKKEK